MTVAKARFKRQCWTCGSSRHKKRDCPERTGELDGNNDDYDAFDRDDGFQGRGGHDRLYGPAERADFLDWAGSNEDFLTGNESIVGEAGARRDQDGGSRPRPQQDGDDPSLQTAQW